MRWYLSWNEKRQKSRFPRGLKPARNGKNKQFNGTTEQAAEKGCKQPVVPSAEADSQSKKRT
jgi:hypothetical protein